jgi:DNA-binding response OmpR family regulator
MLVVRGRNERTNAMRTLTGRGVGHCVVVVAVVVVVVVVCVRVLSMLQVCDVLRQRYKTSALPVIMVSAKNREKEIIRGLEVRTVPVFSK